MGMSGAPFFSYANLDWEMQGTVFASLVFKNTLIQGWGAGSKWGRCVTRDAKPACLPLRVLRVLCKAKQGRMRIVDQPR